jgi:LCP family protein required for cell wall assembly
MTRSPTIRRIAAASIALMAWAAGTFAGALGTAPAQARPTFVIGRAHGEFLPITDPERPIFLLLIGSDARPGTELENGLADSLHILGINVAAKRATLYGIPRDSWVPLSCGGENKINTAMSACGGPQGQVDTVENLTGIPIDYYVLTGFNEFSNFIRSIDGVAVQNPYAFSGTGRSYAAGEIELDGPSALSFSRERKGLPSGDFHRSWNQGLVLEGLLQQFRGDFAKDQASTYHWLGSGLQQVHTELPIQEVLDLTFAVTQLRPTRVTNLVATGGTGTEGGTSVVILSSENDALWADMAQDGYLLQRQIPPNAQPGL